MDKLKKIIDASIQSCVSDNKEREAIIEFLDIEKRFKGTSSIDIIDKYEKIVERLV